MDESQNPTQPLPPPPPPPPQVPKLTRSSTDRVLAGVCGGLGRHFGVDPLIFRIAAIVLVLMGGAGLLLYIALALLVPSDAGAPAGTVAAAAETQQLSGGNRVLVIIGVIVAVIVAGPLLAIPLLIIGVPLLVLGGLLVPLAVLALLGLAVWWLVSGDRPEGGAGAVARAALLGVGVLILLSVVAVASFWAAAAGGGTVIAGLVIAAGVMLVAGAFVGGARWLILPALAVALPLALVSAAGIDLDGGVGDRYYDPATAADIRDRYELGAGSLVLDLRDVAFAPGDYGVELDVGMGEAVVYVPEHVCVATRAEIGAGAARVFDRDNGGVDVDWEQTPDAAEDVPRLFVDADIGLGELRVRHDDFEGFTGFREGRRFQFDDGSEPGNQACAGVRARGAAG
jgi:phage shock protein PspC (stress-responsive transcriptional regulator)